MGRRGVSLAECAVALVAASALVAAVHTLLRVTHRLVREQTARLAVRQSVRAAAGVLRSELEAAALPALELVRFSESALELRALRGFGVLCAAPGGGVLQLEQAVFSSLRAVDPARDSALVFSEGDPTSAADDAWVPIGITSVRSGFCPDGRSALELVPRSLAAGATAGIAAGSPVRVFEVVEYRLYADGTGSWWLGVRSPSTTGGWSATSPIAGPLRRRDGLALRYLDAAGQATATAGDVRLVEVVVRGVTSSALWPYRDSLAIRVKVGLP
jgi:hypothetical protein